MSNKKPQNPNSLANLAPPFSSTNQPKNKNGRKPSKMKKFIQDNNLTTDDLRNMCKYVLPLEEEKIKELLTDESKPMAMRIFARAVIDDFRRKDLKNIMILMDRAFGKPTEKIDLNANQTETVVFYLPDNGRDSVAE